MYSSGRGQMRCPLHRHPRSFFPGCASRPLLMSQSSEREAGLFAASRPRQRTNGRVTNGLRNWTVFRHRIRPLPRTWQRQRICASPPKLRQAPRRRRPRLPGTCRTRSKRTQAFDPTAGFPGEGPPRSVSVPPGPVRRRLPGGLEATVGQSTQNARSRGRRHWEQSAQFFPGWETSPLDFLDTRASLLLRELYGGDAPLGHAKDLIGFLTAERGLSLPRSRRLFRRWRALEPSAHRVPLPEVWYRAAIAFFLVSGDTAMALWLVGTWSALARPGELLGCKARQALPWRGKVFISLPKSKTSGKQFLTLQGPEVPWFSTALESMPPETNIVGLSASTVASRFGTCLKRLGLEGRGLTPASLRTGAATALYLATECVDPVRWRMRHKSFEYSENYIQEQVCALLEVGSKTPALVENLAALLPDLLG